MYVRLWIICIHRALFTEISSLTISGLMLEVRAMHLEMFLQSFLPGKCLTDIICFSSTGDVKLFDFGLAKELDPSLRSGCSEMYELSGNTGSLRYMSPEVARSEPYNLSADVYSFGLLLWQICALDLPYDGMNRQDHSELVVHGNERPPLDSSWSTPLRILMKRSWEPDPLVRPSMDSIYKILRREICALRDGDDSGLEHTRRRSTFVLNRDSAAGHDGERRSKKSGSARASEGINGIDVERSTREKTSSKQRASRAQAETYDGQYDSPTTVERTASATALTT
jgi:serine/threonine protein kinase